MNRNIKVHKRKVEKREGVEKDGQSRRLRRLDPIAENRGPIAQSSELSLAAPPTRKNSTKATDNLGSRGKKTSTHAETFSSLN